MEDSVIDRESFLNLKESLGDSLLPLIVAFKENTNDLLSQAEASYNERDNLGVAKAGNALKLPSNQLGAVKLSAIAQEIEYAGKANQMGIIPSLITEAKTLAEKTFTELNII